MLTETAAQTARELLSGDRLAHTLAVGQRASQLGCTRLTPRDALRVASAGYLHDVGYGQQAVAVGWHPLDGARWLRAAGWPDDITRLVAWHSCAEVEGELRGLYDVAVADFGSPPTGPAVDVLVAADFTTGPTGQSVSLDQRIEDIRRRYSADSLVITALDRIEPQIRAATARTYALPQLGLAPE